MNPNFPAYIPPMYSWWLRHFQERRKSFSGKREITHIDCYSPTHPILGSLLIITRIGYPTPELESCSDSFSTFFSPIASLCKGLIPLNNSLIGSMGWWTAENPPCQWNTLPALLILIFYSILSSLALPRQFPKIILPPVAVLIWYQSWTLFYTITF